MILLPQKIIRAVISRLYDKRFLKFILVGGSGVFVNMLTLYLLTEYGKIHYSISSLIAIELSILFNFTINNSWTWGDRNSTSLTQRLLSYHVAAGITAFFGNWCVLLLLTELFGMHYMPANLIGIAVGSLFNFFANDLWTFRNVDQKEKERV